MSSERKLPVHKTEFSLIDSEFNSIRDRFDDEMHKMEQEMERFRNQLQDREKDFFSGRSMITQSSHKSSSHTTTTSDSDHRSRQDNWLDELKSPLIQDSDDGKVLKLRFDVTQYTPEEIVVKTVDNKLQVQAKHEEKSAARSMYREYNREFLLPKGVNPEMIKSTLSKDGVLTVEAPLPAIESSNERRIPISNK